MEDIVLSTFFEIDHELHRNTGTTGPPRIRRLRAVAMQIPGISLVRMHVRGPLDRCRRSMRRDSPDVKPECRLSPACTKVAHPEDNCIP